MVRNNDVKNDGATVCSERNRKRMLIIDKSNSLPAVYENPLVA